MPVTIEFYGIARRRAGIASIQVEADSIGAALDRVAAALPHWADACMAEGQLKSMFLANLNARSFVAERNHRLQDGDHLLILAADVGG